MARLFKTTQELKTAVPVLKNVTLESWEGTVETAEQFYLKKILGTVLYDALVASHNPGPASGVLATLLPYAQKVSGNMGVYEWLPLIYSQTSDAGERVTVTENTERSPKWAFDMKRKTLLELGGKAIENLYTFLNANSGSYPTWVNPTRFYFVNSLSSFEDPQEGAVSLGGSWWTFNALLPKMAVVEENIIRHTLGDDLYNTLKTKLTAGAALTAEETILRNKLKKPIAHLTLAHGLQPLKMQLTPSGAMVPYERNPDGISSQPADDSLLEREARKLESLGSGMLHNVTVYLNATATDSIFADYYNSDLYTEPVDPDNPTRTPDLGNDRRSGLFVF